MKDMTNAQLRAMGVNVDAQESHQVDSLMRPFYGRSPSESSEPPESTPQKTTGEQNQDKSGHTHIASILIQ